MRRSQLERFVATRNASAFSSNLQFDLDASACGFDVKELGPGVGDGEGGYVWHTAWGKLVERAGKLTLEPSPLEQATAERLAELRAAKPDPLALGDRVAFRAFGRTREGIVDKLTPTFAWVRFRAPHGYKEHAMKVRRTGLTRLPQEATLNLSPEAKRALGRIFASS